MRVLHTIRLLLLTVAMLATVTMLRADEPVVAGHFSTDSVEIGDQFEYILTIDKDRATEIGVPAFGDMLTREQQSQLNARKAEMSTFEEYDDDLFELVENYPIDTLKVEGRRLYLRKRYRLAAMETGDMHLRPAILYFAKNRDLPDTLYGGDTATLHVARYELYDTTSFLVADPMQGVKVDSLKAMHYLRTEGITTQKDLPFVFKEIQDYVIYGTIIAVVVALLVWLGVVLLARYIARRAERVKPQPKIPAHIVANKALVALSHRKLWQNGKFKQYYTSLTQILRVYISERWGVGALEMTTDEIIAALADVDIPRDSRMELVAVLRTADMVKFAKAQPDGEENEACYTRAYYFVENTKPVTDAESSGKGEITIETKIND